MKVASVSGGYPRVRRSSRYQWNRRQNYQRPMPKVYAYLRKVPIQTKTFVSYPYGLGGNTLLDRVTGNVNFDNWLVTSILSYFSARYLDIFPQKCVIIILLSDLFCSLLAFPP